MSLYIAPSGFPQEVSVGSISSQGAELSWNPPLLEERNGIITGYAVTVGRYDTESQLQLASTLTAITLSMLDPFTVYTVAIAASTTIGVGPQSTQLSFRTAEDGNVIAI